MDFKTIIGLTVNALSQRGTNVDLNTPLATIDNLVGSIGAQLVNLGQF